MAQSPLVQVRAPLLWADGGDSHASRVDALNPLRLRLQCSHVLVARWALIQRLLATTRLALAPSTSHFFFSTLLFLLLVTLIWLVAKNSAQHWLHSASGEESLKVSPRRRIDWKTVICIFAKLIRKYAVRCGLPHPSACMCSTASTRWPRRQRTRASDCYSGCTSCTMGAAGEFWEGSAGGAGRVVMKRSYFDPQARFLLPETLPIFTLQFHTLCSQVESWASTPTPAATAAGTLSCSAWGLC